MTGCEAWRLADRVLFPLGTFFFFLYTCRVNIFIILLTSILIGMYYFMDSPTLTVPGETRAEAMETMALKSILSCVVHAQTNAINIDKAGDINQRTVFEFDLPCVERYEITSVKFCTDDRRVVPNCTPDRPDRQISNFIVTSTPILTSVGAGRVLGILRTEYPFAANFGIISIGDDRVPRLLTSGGLRRDIAPFIAREAEFADGQLVYITQYAVRGTRNPAIAAGRARIRCPVGEIPLFRQNQWVCTPRNIIPVCSGQTVWDPINQVCVPDNRRRPLCHQNQSTVMVDGRWECINPEQRTDCPANTRAEFNYENLVWLCVPIADEEADNAHRCRRIYERIFGGGQTALRGSLISCNDCEQMIVHEDCTAVCIPDSTAINRRSCYDGICRGSFYFGFPNQRYIDNAKIHLPELKDANIPLDYELSRNRRFNCIECPHGIDTVASRPPYVIICR